MTAMWENVCAAVEQTEASTDTPFEMYDAGVALAAIGVSWMSPEDRALLLSTVNHRIGGCVDRLIETGCPRPPRASNGHG